MKRAELYAVERGCTNAFLDTFSFQARPFYEKLGYRVFGILENHLFEPPRATVWRSSINPSLQESALWLAN